jgi:hypothetical protein
MEIQRQTMYEVTIPLAKAAITGFLAACIAAFVVVIVTIFAHWPAMVPPVVWFGVFSISATVQWLLLINKKGHRALENVDLYPQEPVNTSELFITVLTKAPGNTSEQMEPGDKIETFGLHISETLMRAVLKSVTSGAHQWSYRSLSAIPGFSEKQARTLLEEMLRAGFLEFRDGQRNHPKGHILTASGRSLVRRLTKDS